jgi:hypothetical protein
MRHRVGTRKPAQPATATSNSEQIVELKKRIRMMARGYVVLGFAIVLALGGVVKLAYSQKSTTREGLQSRVKTVEQRCDLTRKLQVVLEKDDPARVPAFRISWEKCEKQLGEVQRILVKAGG